MISLLPRTPLLGLVASLSLLTPSGKPLWINFLLVFQFCDSSLVRSISILVFLDSWVCVGYYPGSLVSVLSVFFLYAFCSFLWRTSSMSGKPVRFQSHDIWYSQDCQQDSSKPPVKQSASSSGDKYYRPKVCDIWLNYCCGPSPYPFC